MLDRQNILRANTLCFIEMCSSLLKCFQHVFAVAHVKKRKGFRPKRQSPPPLSPVPIKKIEIQACIVIEIGERPPLIEINRSDASSILFRDPCDTRCVSYMEVSKPPFANNNYALSSNVVPAPLLYVVFSQKTEYKAIQAEQCHKGVCQ